MTIDLNPKFDWGKYFIYLCLILIGCLIMSLFKCSDIPITSNSTQLKQLIQKETDKKDSVKEVIIKQDSVRIEYITKWRKLKSDTIFVPCDTLLKRVVTLCDTIIVKDSILISSLKTELKYDSLIISWHQKIQMQDSVEILALKKEVKKQKRQKKFFQLTTILSLGVVVLK